MRSPKKFVVGYMGWPLCLNLPPPWLSANYYLAHTLIWTWHHWPGKLFPREDCLIHLFSTLSSEG